MNVKIDLDILVNLIVGLRAATALEMDTQEAHLRSGETRPGDPNHEVVLAITSAVSRAIWRAP